MSTASPAQRLFRRAWGAAVFWTWLFNALRFASGLLLLPLLWRIMPEKDLGLYSMFVLLSAFPWTIEGTFSATITRNVGYVMQGVTDIQALGIAGRGEAAGLNVTLLGRLFSATRLLYRYFSLGILLLLGGGGTLLLYDLIPQTSNPSVSWWAWSLTVLSACLDLYAGYWLVFLRGMNHVVISARLSAVIYGLRLLLSIVLLLCGLGLLAVPVATFICATLQRIAARRFLVSRLPSGFHADPAENRQLVARLWPTAWRMAAVMLSLNVMLAGSASIISRLWGLEATYKFQFSLQILYSVCMNMASVWTLVKWPLVTQLRAAQDNLGIQKLLWPRLWLQLLTYAVLAVFCLTAAPVLLKWISPDKSLLPFTWLAALALHTLLETHYSFWTTLLATENRVPSLRSAVVTNLLALALGAGLAVYSDLGPASFIVAPLLSGLVFNFWYWPLAGAQSIGTGWTHFMFRRPSTLAPPA